MSALPGVVTQCYRSQFGEPGFDHDAIRRSFAVTLVAVKGHVSGYERAARCCEQMLRAAVSETSLRPVPIQASKPTTHLPNQCLLRPIPAETLPNQLVKLELHLPLPS